MKRNSLLFVAVLALASWAFAQQPSSPAPPAAGSPPPPAGTTAAPSSAPATQPPDSPAPPASPDAGQSSTSGQSAGASGQSPDSSSSSQSGSSSAAQDQDASASDNNSGRPLTSEEARKQIERKLQSEPGLSSRDIHVDVTDNAVVLNGSVPTTNQSLLAQRIAQSYAGSRRVSNKLNIQTTSPANGSPSSGPPQQATPPQGK